ncbi:hypothetical protein [Actinacidiphila bryophytorum]|uniref:hypothetical protein n=1 Tax=Actinacidiphila bryophytorum TaxID=1436133 RepID=UPI00196104DD|nr:hypothetical protein [Actinacidiphila bryophytorum]MBM9438564.1 hypothetical protein [Actinacidiphila bryophytorum]MBN6547442.1 hypothetical protein [Actinacidiphila bryophytorum]
MLNRRVASVLVGAAAVIAPVAINAPAQAAAPSSAKPSVVRPMVLTAAIGANGTSARCQATGKRACFFAGPSVGSTYAIWSTSSSSQDLTGYYFGSSGTGENTAVYHMAQALACSTYAPNSCTVYAGYSYAGNSDHESHGQVGKLYYTNKAAYSFVV